MVLYSWGWRRGRFTNKSSGVSIQLGRMLNERHVRAVISPEESLQIQGRVGAIRVVTPRADLLLAAVYLPPRSCTLDYRRAVCMRVLSFLAKTVRRMPSTTQVIIGGDLNMEFKCGSYDGIGEHCSKKSTPGAEWLEDFMERNSLEATNYFEHGPTFYAQGHCSFVDHFLMFMGGSSRSSTL